MCTRKIRNHQRERAQRRDSENADGLTHRPFSPSGNWPRALTILTVIGAGATTVRQAGRLDDDPLSVKVFGRLGMGAEARPAESAGICGR